jgi:isopentenyldiphosphate isomerase
MSGTVGRRGPEGVTAGGRYAEADVEEVLDVYDDNMRRLGTETRAAVHERGLWHRTFHCWIVAERRGARSVLFQLRGPHREVFPGMLDITAAGHLTAGESAEDGVRELEEELGVRADLGSLQALGTRCDVAIVGDVVNREFCHTYLLRDSRPIGDYVPREDEVAGLVEVELNDGLRLFSGETDAIEVSSVSVHDRSTVTRRAIGVTDVIPRCDPYYLKVFIMAERLLNGERYLAI